MGVIIPNRWKNKKFQTTNQQKLMVDDHLPHQTDVVLSDHGATGPSPLGSLGTKVSWCPKLIYPQDPVGLSILKPQMSVPTFHSAVLTL